MKIYIEDSLEGPIRKKLLEVMAIKYALKLFKGNKTRSAEWLGISKRGMRLKVKQYEELKEYRLEPVYNFEAHRELKRQRDKQRLEQD